MLRQGEDPAEGLFAKDPEATYSPAAHVRMGSRLHTRYISTTSDINVATKWSALSGNPIAEINLGLVDSPIYDLTTQAGRDLYLPGNLIALAEGGW